MPNKQIDEFVSENRAELEHIDSEFFEVSTRRDTNLSFTRNTINVTFSINIFKRSLGNELISAHQNGDVHGSANGKSGDSRGKWSRIASKVVSEQITISGRNAIRDALSGEGTGQTHSTAIGQGSTTAQLNNTDLEDKTATTTVWANKPQENEVQSKGIFLSTEHLGEITEFGIYSTGGNLIGRITTDAINPTPEEEVRVSISMTFSGDGTGKSKITTIGEAILADSMNSSGPNTGIDKIIFGSGTSSASKSDSELENKIIGKRATREKSPEQVTAHAYLFKSEPEEQPANISEMGVVDTEDRLLWRTNLREFEKSDGFQIESFVGFRIQ